MLPVTAFSFHTGETTFSLVKSSPNTIGIPLLNQFPPVQVSIMEVTKIFEKFASFTL